MVQNFSVAQIACVAHVGFDRLLKFVEKLNAGNYSFENDFASEASNLTFDNVHIDFEASQIQKETGIQLDKVPIYSSRDGNCFFNALSLHICGSEKLSSKLRLACCVDLLKNDKEYRSKASKMFFLTGVTYEEA